MRNWAQNLLCAKGRYGMIGFRAAMKDFVQIEQKIDDN